MFRQMNGKGRLEIGEIEKVLDMTDHSAPVFGGSEVNGIWARPLLNRFELSTMLYAGRSQEEQAMKDIFQAIEALKNRPGEVRRHNADSGRAVEGLERRVKELEEGYVNMAMNMVVIQEARESYHRGHAQRVAKLSTKIASAMGLPAEEVMQLELAARLHDLGRISIPAKILFKPASLTIGEWAEVQLHPLRAVELLRPCRSLRKVLPVIECHHERFDGGGYPNGYKGEEIPLMARILAVADAYDGMTSLRPYRASMSSEEAMDILEQGMETQWDPEVVETFLGIMRPSGARVIHTAS